MRTLLRTLILLFVAATLRAQQPVDVDLTPTDATLRYTPLQIQSAATIGEITLAVWGTSFNDDRDSLLPRLVMQLAMVGTETGLRQTLTSTAARPYGVVKVIPCSGAFLVLWNDRRDDAHGIYYRRVDVRGEMLGVERMLTTGSIYDPTGFGIGVAGVPSQGQAVIYNVGLGAFGFRIDAAGMPVDTVRRIGTNYQGVYSFASLPGLHLADLGSEARVIYDDGRIDPRPVPLESKALAFHVGPDSSLAMIFPRVIEVYRSMFDQTPVRTVTTDMLDSVSSQVAALHRRSVGEYDIDFAVVTDIPQGQQGTIVAGKKMTFYTARLSADGTLSAPVPVLSREVKGSSEDNSSYQSPDVSVLRGESNTYLFELRFPSLIYAGTDSVQTRTAIYRYSLDALGRLQFDRSFGTRRDSVEGSPSGFQPVVPADPTSIVRLAVLNESRVRVKVAGRSVELTAPTGSMPAKISRILPSIGVVGGDLMAAWLQSLGPELARWSGEEEPARIYDFFVPDTLASLPVDSSRSEQVVRVSRRYSTRLMDNDNPIIPGPVPAFVGHDVHTDEVVYHSSPEVERTYENNQYRSYAYMGTPTGWKRLIQLYTTGQGPDVPAPWVRSDGWEPNRKELVLRFGTGSGDQGTMAAFGPDAVERWRTPCAAARLPLVLLGASEYLLFTDTTAVHYRGADSIATYPMPPLQRKTVPTYRRLLGPRFLRIASYYTTKVEHVIERYDLAGRRLDSISFDGPERRIIQDDRDSTLLVLHISDGVRLTRLTPDLRTIFADSLIIRPANGAVDVTATLRNDTLFVLWLDQKPGAPTDVHATWLRLERYVPAASAVTGEATDEDVSGLSIAPAAPNPARGRVELGWNLPTRGAVMVEVIDRLGRAMMTRDLGAMEAGAHRLGLAVDELPAGAYQVRISSGALHAETPLVVAR